MTERKGFKSSDVTVNQDDATFNMVRRIAHDFNNLITPLLAYPKLVKMDLPDESNSHSLLDTIERTARDMAHMSRELLMLSSEITYDKSELNVNQIVEEVVEELNGQERDDGVEIECGLAENLSRIEGSVEYVEQAIESLCANAVEAFAVSEEPSKPRRVLVKTESCKEESRAGRCGNMIDAGNYVRISVSDNGPGIAGDVENTICEPFVTTKRNSEQRGAGLGLSIVSRIVRGHGGCIDFSSAEGEGAVFSLLFPASKGGNDDDKNQPKSVPESSVGSKNNGASILIVDDESAILRLFQMILSTAIPGCKIDMASNGAEALKSFEENRQSVVLMDLHMPVMDGQAAFLGIEKLCKERNWEEPSVVFCTGFVPSETLRQMVADNPRHALLSKPVSGAVLVSEVKSRLG